jgi:hypothetical protein
MATENIPIIEIIAIVVAIAGFASGLFTYKKEQMLRRKESLFSELEKFDINEDLTYAKAILDDFAITIDNKTFHKLTLEETLRDHRKIGVSHNGEQLIRESFDSLLDFFGRLEYLIETKLLDKEKDLYHFDYYIKRAAELKPIQDYVRIYQFPLRGILHEELNKNRVES